MKVRDVLDVLDDAARRATKDPKVKAREGQAKFSADIISAMEPPSGHVAASCPVGVGKSLATTVPAMMRAALHGERTVVSTESISLMTQYAEKDLPVVREAVKAATGVDVPFAVYKGWSNFVCALSVQAHALALLGEHGLPIPAAARVDSADGLRQLVQLLRKIRATTAKGPVTAEISGMQIPIRELTDLLEWAAKAVTRTDPSDADRGRYPHRMPEGGWAAASVSPGECAGVDTCPFAGLCAPARARERAASASVVVTNHSMLAVQATTRAPVVIGNRRLGVFEHIIIDEAHTLPGIIRAAGSCEVSARRIGSLIAGAKRLLDDQDKFVQGVIEDGDVLADQLTAVLSNTLRRASTDGLVRLGEQDNPLDGLEIPVTLWAQRLNKLVSSLTDHPVAATAIKARRLAARVDSLINDVKTVAEHSYGVARWAERNERDDNLPVAKASPVDVSSALKQNLWTSPVQYDDAGEPLISERRWVGPRAGEEDDNGLPGSEEEDRRYALSVTACSGTLPPAFEFQMGMNSRVKHYPSPFETAYSSSMLYVPRCVDEEDVLAVCGATPPGRKPKLDVNYHQRWAADKIDALVDASNGSALILASTARAGREYAAMLRTRFAGRFHIYSQWDGRTAGALVAMWRDDTNSVLVGTRSLMTGTDAPGRTCQLVIVDRIPRSSSNPVDDARVEAIMDAKGVDRWTADRDVYVSDAALLLEQSAGRLVRSVSDVGLVAVLDPRLLKVGVVKYPEPTRRIYMDALAAFTQRASRLENALNFLHGLEHQHRDAA